MANNDNGLGLINSRDDRLIEGFKAAYVDGNIVSDPSYTTEFVYNKNKEKNVAHSIEVELLNCDKF